MPSVPILMYHEVTPEPHPAYRKWSVALSQFRAHMRWLATAGYATVDLDTLLEARCGRRTLPARAVVITFDDGYRDCVRYTLPILRDHGFSATYFLVTSLIGMTAEWLREDPGIELPLLSWREVEEIEAAGCRCEAHSMTHPELTSIPAEHCWDELRLSRLVLERRLGRPVRHMAYPYGKFDERVRAMARHAGYRSARSTQPGLSPSDDDPYALRQVPILGTDSLVDFVCRLRTGQTGRELLRRKARGALRRWGQWRAS